MKVRHQVERIQPEAAQTFDQQFWPVLIAICVVGSMAAGAIVTLVQGPWMWASLLALPAAAGISILLLYHLDDSVLRRSLQIAILGSLAIHLLVLVVTSLTFIFGVLTPDEIMVVSKQPEKKILVSNRMKQFVFQQSHKHETPDREVTADKTQSTILTQPQPVPVKERHESANQQIAQRREIQPNKPRFDKQASQMRRNTQGLKPVSSQGAAPSSTSSQTAARPAQPTAAPTEVDVRRESKPAAAAIQRQSPPASPSSEKVETISERRQASEAPASRSRRATARIRKENPRAPKVATEVVSSESKPIELQPVESRPIPTESSEIQVAKNQVTATKASKQKSMASVEPAPLAQIRTERRPTTEKAVENSVNQPTSQFARTASAKAPTVQSQTAPSQPRAMVESANRSVQPKTLALSRASGGVTGSGQAGNLDRIQGGQPSPVNVASDSSNQRRSDRSSENISLSSLQSSQRAERGKQSKSQRVLRADTKQWASRSGSADPAHKAIQAAAANVDSSIAQSSTKSAAEKGDSILDLGPTKIVTETTADRRSGGGRPELSDALDSNPADPGGRKSGRSPNVQIASDSESTESTSAMQVTGKITTEQNADADQVTRNQPGSEVATRTAAIDTPAARNSATATSENLRMASRNSDRDEGYESAAGANSHESKIKGDASESGNSRSRLAQAPAVNRQVEFGFTGDGKSQAADAPDANLEASTGELVRQTADSLSGSGLLATATKMMATSMAGMPLVAGGPGTVNRRETNESLDADQSTESDAIRGEHSLQPQVQSNLSGQLTSNHTADVPAGTNGIPINERAGAGTLDRRSPMTASSSPGAAMEIEAPEGPTGFADIASRRVGRNERATTETDQLSPTSESRFRREEFGGLPTSTPNAPIAKEAFRKRNPAALAESGPSTEAAIEMGLEFLAKQQLPDGSWTLGQFDREHPLFQSQLNSDTAATGLALLAFQGAGYNHREYKYARQVRSAVDWLIANQAPDGGLYLPSDQASNDSARLYSHAIAALALTEAYGMTQDSVIRDATQKALDYIANSQHSTKGGWRYFDRDVSQSRSRSSDTSVTGWMMMALQSGRLAGLETEQSTLDGIDAWLRVAQSPDSPSEFRYNPYAVDSDGKSRTHGKQSSVTMTSVGLLMRVYSGWGQADPRFLKGAERLLQQLPSDRDARVRDTYYWYYATQVMKHAGGEYWQQWNQALHPLLIGTQQKQGEMRGSWHPYEPVPDRWGPQGGRIYVTAMNLLSLEVRYRLLPLYEKTIK